MTNRVTLTFEFTSLSDGSDEDLIEDAIGRLVWIAEALSDWRRNDLVVACNAVGGPDYPGSGQCDLKIEVAR